MPIPTINSSNTFDEFRQTTNLTIAEVNSLQTRSSANGSSTIVLRDTSGNFAANTITATTFSGGYSGSGTSLTNLNATNISSGTLDNARTTASSSNGASTIVARDASGNFTANVITATTFSGSGDSLTSLNGSNISTGTISNARTTASSANGASTIVARDASGNFTANTITATTFSGNANASIITSGTIATARLASGTANANTYLRGDQTWSIVPLPDGQTAGSTANGYLQYSGTTPVSGQLNGSTTNPTNTLRINYEGYFYATRFYGDGSNLSNTNASSLTLGTVGTARLASGTANANTYLRGDQTWAVVSSGATITDDTSSNNTFYVGLAGVTSGSWTQAYVSSTKLYFNANTGTLSATNLNSLSDLRLKEEVEIIENAISTVSKINGVKFKWKENNRKSYGVIAQELEKILPELVEGENIKTVNYGGLIAFLINAVKELDDRIRKLES